MKLYSLLFIAWRNLWAHRLRATLTIGGVTLGVGAIVFLVSLGFGLERLVTNQVANFDAFTQIDVPSANLKTGKINDEAITRIGKISHVSEINEVVDLAARARLASQKSTSETVAVGANPKYFNLTQTTIKNGRPYTHDSRTEIVINESLANLLGFEGKVNTAVGKELMLDLIIPADLRARDTSETPLVKSDIYVLIVGIAAGTDSPTLFMPLKLADAYGVVNRTSLKIKVDNRDNIPQVRQAIENSGFSTEYVGDTVDQIAQVFSLFRVVLGGFGLIALTVAALGTFNTLTISLMERIREVGLLKTLGMKQKDIFRLFMAESLTIGVIGGLVGLVLASLTGWALNAALQALAVQSGADIVTVYYTPASFIIGVALGSLVVGFLTGIYPARRAIKMNALDVIRYQ